MAGCLFWRICYSDVQKSWKWWWFEMISSTQRIYTLKIKQTHFDLLCLKLLAVSTWKCHLKSNHQLDKYAQAYLPYIILHYRYCITANAFTQNVGRNIGEYSCWIRLLSDLTNSAELSKSSSYLFMSPVLKNFQLISYLPCYKRGNQLSFICQVSDRRKAIKRGSYLEHNTTHSKQFIVINKGIKD
jgi:hypothetical protein